MKPMPQALGRAFAGSLLAVGTLSAQGGLRSRIEGNGDARVQFSFAARSDVCGAGASIQIGSSTYIANGSGRLFDGDGRPLCRRGPVVVRVTRSAGIVVGLDVQIAPESSTDGIADLGTVSAVTAAEYLLDFAARAEGRPAREAILPAVLADSATIWPGLIALAKNRALARAVRQSAMNWLGRELDRSSGDDARRASAALVTLATDQEEMLPVRQQAVSVLARSERADLTALTSMANGNDTWLRQNAIEALANSGDPRARDYLRSALQDPALPDPLRTTVIRGLGREYATSRDVDLLRARYATLTSNSSKQAILSVLAEEGGAANLQWLLTIASDSGAAPDLRAQATESVQRAGASAAQLGKLYEQAPDRRGKEAAINGLLRRGDRQSVDLLLGIARNETDQSVRRGLVARLGRLEDARVKDFLRDLVNQ